MQKLQSDAQAEGRALLRVRLLRISGVSANTRAARARGNVTILQFGERMLNHFHPRVKRIVPFHANAWFQRYNMVLKSLQLGCVREGT